MNYAAGQKVKIPSEFFERDDELDMPEVTIVGPAPANIQDGYDVHDACYIVRADDGQESIVCCDYMLPC